jgi:hypothetical protein
MHYIQAIKRRHALLDSSFPTDSSVSLLHRGHSRVQANERSPGKVSNPIYATELCRLQHLDVTQIQSSRLVGGATGRGRGGVAVQHLS